MRTNGGRGDIFCGFWHNFTRVLLARTVENRTFGTLDWPKTRWIKVAGNAEVLQADDSRRQSTIALLLWRRCFMCLQGVSDVTQGSIRCRLGVD